ncbi:glycosyltransferase family protein [Bacteroides stercorirosoris]|uniref:hypothetical protein n=1 Tax=Bacteroides stercorirosoris TaxID=871324 RepID=UPI001FB0B88C|nr:hypothetical protein [Bacteroides stercorirosoris]
MKLVAVVVLYHPDENLVRNINSYLPQVDTLVLWDNTPEGRNQLLFPYPVSVIRNVWNIWDAGGMWVSALH